MKFKLRGFKTSPYNAWDKHQVKLFCEQALARVGGEKTWVILSKPMRRWAIAKEALSVVCMQHKAIDPKAASDLLYDMEKMFGLEE